jgi:hypothetical protein
VCACPATVTFHVFNLENGGIFQNDSPELEILNLSHSSLLVSVASSRE